MHWQYTPFTIPLVAVGVGMVVLAIYALRKYPTRETGALALLSFGVAEWSLVYAVELASADLSVKYLCLKFEFFGALIIPAAWLWFSLLYTKREKWLTARRLLPLLVEPIVILALVWTNDAHGLILQDWKLNTASGYAVLEETYGAALKFDVFYSHSLLLAGTLVFLNAFFRSRALYRDQIGAILVAAAAPWILNATSSLGLSPFGPMHLTPFAFSISCLALFIAVFRFRLLDLAPVARDAIIENMRDIVIVLDTHNRVADLNPAACKALGLTPADVIGKPGEEAFAAWPNLVEHCGGDTERATVIFDREEGLKTFELDISAIFNRRKHAVGRLIVLRDVTKRERAQKHVRLLSSAVEQTTDGVAVVTMDGRLLFVNKAFASAHGYNPDEIVGRHLSIFHTPDQLPAVEEANRILIETGAFSGEIWHTHRDGSPFPTIMQNTILRGDDGVPIGLIGTLVDITNRKVIEDELLLANARLTELETLRENLVNMIVHDMKNPVTTTLLGLDLVESDPLGRLTAKQTDNLQMAKRNQFKISEMINNLLEISKIEAGALKAHMVEMDIYGLIGRVIDRYRAMASMDDISIYLEVEPDVSVITSDLWLIDRILSNLISNAIKHSYPNGHVVIAVVTEHASRDLSISVEDYGEGIPEEYHEKIFDKFYQVELREQGHRTDTGLGLTFCQLAAETLGGVITVDSKPDKGSRFTLVLSDALPQV